MAKTKVQTQKKQKPQQQKPKNKSSPIPKKGAGSGFTEKPKARMCKVFSNALGSPFHPSTLGCRVPDPYSFPTSVYHVHGNIVMQSTPAGTSAAMFLPTPILSAIDVSRINTGSSAIIDGSGMMQFGASGMITYQATTTAAMAALFGSYRVVSWGIKVTNLQPELSATGRMFAALFPTAATIPCEALLKQSNIDAVNLCPDIVGENALQLGSSQLLAQNTGVQLAVQDLLRGDLMVAGSYTDPTFFRFKNLNPSSLYNSASVFGGETFVTNAGAANAYNGDPVNMSGGVAIALYAEGLPASTKCFNVEFIYHLEGPTQMGVLANTPIASVSAMMPVGTMDVVSEAVASVAGTKSMSWMKGGLNFANELASDPTLSTAIGIAGMLL